MVHLGMCQIGIWTLQMVASLLVCLLNQPEHTLPFVYINFAQALHQSCKEEKVPLTGSLNMGSNSKKTDPPSPPTNLASGG